MGSVEEITAAIEQLTIQDMMRLRDWLVEYAEQLWDEQMERDAKAGRLDALAKEALEELRAGKTFPL
jgi:hypothetical protein